MSTSSFRKLFHRAEAGTPVPPVLLIGPHRSGTTLITACLEQAGLFVGAELDPNKEAQYFLRLNDWMLNQAGCRWDLPGEFERLFAHPGLRAKITEQMRRMMTSASASTYLGRKPSRGSTGVSGIGGPWGWKDPRNCFTLPVWLDLFPDAKVVFVRRHGADAAASLTTRSLSVLERWKPRNKLFPSDMVTDSARCLSLDGAFMLWVDYMQAAEKNTRGLGDRLFCIQYEEFLSHPADCLRNLIAFCGLYVDERTENAIITGIRTERAFAYRSVPELMTLSGRRTAELAAFGYAP